jgi:reactive intermediate/imine deaminase
VPLWIACRAGPPASKAAEFFPMPGQAALPFSEAVRQGNLLFLSGQLGTDSTGHLVPGGIQAETRQALTNIAAVLQRHGSSMDQVVKCTVMLADIKDWAAMNEVYVTFFRSHRPARSAFGTTGLAMGARLELECTATI